jgi:tripartite-type tricarboxylate transporter receptor subunit TctC
VPSIAEAFPGFAVDTWWGLVAPAQTPASVIQKLNQAFVQALQTVETKARFANLMAEPVPTTPDAFGLFMRSELGKYEAVVKRSGARVD